MVRPGRTFLRRMIDLLARFRTVPSDSPQPRVLSRPPLVALAHWSRRQVQFLCDNSSVVAVLNTGSARSSCLMHLLRSLTHSAGIISFSFSTRHTPVVLTLQLVPSLAFTSFSHGFPVPLQGTSRLHRVLRGIQRSCASYRPSCLPVSIPFC